MLLYILRHIGTYLQMKERKGGIYTHRSLKDALDLLLMSRGDPLIFTYSSGFGALALQIKQVRDNFCSNWSSLDWGKREWPPIGTLGEGGVRGVKFRSELSSKICKICTNPSTCGFEQNSYCTVTLKKSSRISGAAIFSICQCK